MYVYEVPTERNNNLETTVQGYHQAGLRVQCIILMRNKRITRPCRYLPVYR